MSVALRCSTVVQPARTGGGCAQSSSARSQSQGAQSAWCGVEDEANGRRVCMCVLGSLPTYLPRYIPRYRVVGRESSKVQNAEHSRSKCQGSIKLESETSSTRAGLELLVRYTLAVEEGNY